MSAELPADVSLAQRVRKLMENPFFAHDLIVEFILFASGSHDCPGKKQWNVSNALHDNRAGLTLRLKECCVYDNIQDDEIWLRFLHSLSLGVQRDYIACAMRLRMVQTLERIRQTVLAHLHSHCRFLARSICSGSTGIAHLAEQQRVLKESLECILKAIDREMESARTLMEE